MNFEYLGHVIMSYAYLFTIGLTCRDCRKEAMISLSRKNRKLIWDAILGKQDNQK